MNVSPFQRELSSKINLVSLKSNAFCSILVCFLATSTRIHGFHFMQILGDWVIWRNSFWDYKMKRRSQRFIFRYTFYSIFRSFLFVFGLFVCHRSNCFFSEEWIRSETRFFPFRNIKFIVISFRIHVHSKLVFNVNVKRMLVIMEYRKASSMCRFKLILWITLFFVPLLGLYFALRYYSKVAVLTKYQTNKQTVAIWWKNPSSSELKYPKYIQRETRDFKWKILQAINTIFDYTQKLTSNFERLCIPCWLLAVGCWPKVFAYI